MRILAIGAAILLRPDGGILLAAIGCYLLWLLLRSLRPATYRTEPCCLRREHCSLRDCWSQLRQLWLL